MATEPSPTTDAPSGSSSSCAQMSLPTATAPASTLGRIQQTPSRRTPESSAETGPTLEPTAATTTAFGDALVLDHQRSTGPAVDHPNPLDDIVLGTRIQVSYTGASSTRP